MQLRLLKNKLKSHCRADAKYLIKFRLWRFGLLFLIFNLLFNLRREIPWQNEFGQHIGNSVSIVIVLSIIGIVSWVTNRFYCFLCHELWVILILATIVTAVLVNLVNETSWGQNITGFTNTRDALDVIWGVIFGLIASLISYQIKASD